MGKPDTWLHFVDKIAILISWSPWRSCWYWPNSILHSGWLCI